MKLIYYVSILSIYFINLIQESIEVVQKLLVAKGSTPYTVRLRQNAKKFYIWIRSFKTNNEYK